MPAKRTTKSDASTTTLEDTIKANVEVLSDVISETHTEDIKGIVCPFFKKGNSPECFGCAQQEETLHDCRDRYTRIIAIRPMEVWEPSFDAIEVREKKK